MPLPTRNTGEERDAFISRCMINPTMVSEFPDEKQRAAVCNSQADLQKDMKIDTVKIDNMEILKTGIWNGHKITTADIDEMIANFKSGILEPFININHDDKFSKKVQGALKVVALGFVSQLKREGERLIANFVQVPRKFAELVEAGMLKKRSIEFFPKGFRLNGKVMNNVLKAVSFFGADVPAVNGLSNDFDVLLKSENHLLATLSEHSESVTLTKMEVVNMSEITIQKSEYQELLNTKNDALKFKADSDSKETQITTLTSDNKGLTDKVTELEKTSEEYKTFKADTVKKEEANVKAEAKTFVDGIVKEGKLLAKYTDDKIEDYVAKAVDAEKLSTFKEQLDSSHKVVDFDQIKYPKGNPDKKVDDDVDLSKDGAVGELTDKVNDAIEAKMKADSNLTFEQAAKSVGVEV